VTREHPESRRVFSVSAGLERSAGAAPVPGEPQRMLDVFIGRWLNEGETSPEPGTSPVEIVTSDVYEWAPGGFFVIHTAYGRIGENEVGAVEILGYDPETGGYRSQLFDSFGNTSFSTLTVTEGVWGWVGALTRCTATFSEDGRIQTAHHERSEGGKTWEPSMTVTLRKIP
jgi:hypothetical protein